MSTRNVNVVSSHKFKATNVIISDLTETRSENGNGNPTFRLQYKYDHGPGPLNIQLDFKTIKQGITSTDGKVQIPINEATKDSLQLSFTDNELFNDKEKYFISEISKLESRLKEAIKPHAHNILNGIGENEDDSMLERLVNGQFHPSISYSFEKDKAGKKTKKRDHKYTSLKLNMYKGVNKDTKNFAYQGRFRAFNQDKDTELTLDNHHLVLPKWSIVKPIVAANAVWIMASTGFGIRWTPTRVNVVSVSEGFNNDIEILDDSDEDPIPVAKVGKPESIEDSDCPKDNSSDSESDNEIDDLQQLVVDNPKVNPVVTPTEKPKLTTKAKRTPK